MKYVKNTGLGYVVVLFWFVLVLFLFSLDQYRIRPSHVPHSSPVAVNAPNSWLATANTNQKKKKVLTPSSVDDEGGSSHVCDVDVFFPWKSRKQHNTYFAVLIVAINQQSNYLIKKIKVQDKATNYMSRLGADQWNYVVQNE